MGYRSQVAFCIKGQTEHITALLTTVRLTLADPPEDPCYSSLKVVHGEDGFSRIGMHEGYVKWYDSYPSVQYFEKVWDLARQDSQGDYVESVFSGAFIRIGEDDTDIETRYFGNDPYDLLGVERSICFGWGSPT